VKRAGQIAILRLPNVDLAPGKPRPVLLLASVPGPYDDWLVCMISTQLRHEIAGFDESIDASSDDFELAGIKVPSVIRIARLAIVASELLPGPIGEIAPDRLDRIRNTLAKWLQGG
jgi:mRNA interferase MazF